MTLPAGVLGSSATNSTCRGYSCWAEAFPGERLELGLEITAVRPAPAHHEGFHHLPAERVGNPDDRDFAHFRMPEQGVLDLHRAHRPAGRDDDIVRPPRVEEPAVLVGAAKVLGRKPSVAPTDDDLSRGPGRGHHSARIADRHLDARHRLAEASRLHGKVGRARIAPEDHPDLRRPVHAASEPPERPFDELGRVGVDRLTGERELLDTKAMATRGPAVLHHPVVGGGGETLVMR